jgi:hypothetical protein
MTFHITVLESLIKVSTALKNSTMSLAEPVEDWITGNDPAFTYLRVIDRGATGEVHEVV